MNLTLRIGAIALAAVLRNEKALIYNAQPIR
jgi:hypothetical protein